jgi:hypothetical protein
MAMTFSRRDRTRRGLALAGLLLAAASSALAAEDPGWQGELRLQWQDRGAATLGPHAAANRLQPGIAPPPPSAALLDGELRRSWQGRLGGTRGSLGLNLYAWHERPAAGTPRGDLRVNELQLSADLGAWQLSAGKKLSGWDVGHGFRPNDLVQQETRRTLVATTPEGRPLLQLEHYGTEHSVSLVWVNPERWNDAADTSRGPRESAFALRAYRRHGALDLHGFAHQGRRTGSSLGAALAWVATDALELHASARWLRRHDGWALDPAAADAPVRQTPWAQVERGACSQWLLGGQWTGMAQQSVLVEYWHDGTALPDAEWDRWAQRNQALAAWQGPQGRPVLPAAALAGNLAWQASPFMAPSLRQDNLYIRLAWQPEAWTLALDALITPADRGRMLGASAQWQGDQWRLNAAWRVNGGPDAAVMAQLPTRRTLLLVATRAF